MTTSSSRKTGAGTTTTNPVKRLSTIFRKKGSKSRGDATSTTTTTAQASTEAESKSLGSANEKPQENGGNEKHAESPEGGQPGPHQAPEADAATPGSNGEFQQSDIDASRPRSASAELVGSGTEDDLIVQRLQGWKHIIKNYLSYFAAARDAEKATIKHFKEVDSQLAVPIRDDHYFATLGSGGVQDVACRIKQLHHLTSQHHQLLVQNLNEQTIPRLHKLRGEVKDEIKSYRRRVGTLFADLQKQNKRVNAAHRAFANAVENPARSAKTDDPYLCEITLKHVLVDRTEVEQRLYAEIKARKEHLREWEATLVERLHEVVNNYLGWRASNATSLLETLRRDQEYIQNFNDDAEWQPFAHKFGEVLDNPQGLQERQSADDVEYPHKGHESTQIIIEGLLEREKRSPLRSLKECYVVLTQLGYLHCFASAADVAKGNPSLSLYVPDCYVEFPRDKTLFVISESGNSLSTPSATHSGGLFSRGTSVLFSAQSVEIADQWVGAVQALAKKLPPKSAVSRAGTGLVTEASVKVNQEVYDKTVGKAAAAAAADTAVESAESGNDKAAAEEQDAKDQQQPNTITVASHDSGADVATNNDTATDKPAEASGGPSAAAPNVEEKGTVEEEKAPEKQEEKPATDNENRANTDTAAN